LLEENPNNRYDRFSYHTKQTDMKTAQNMPNGQVRRTTPPELVTPLRSVGQDKRATRPAREATDQAARITNDLRAQTKNPKSTRSQKGNEHKRHTVQLTTWVHPGVKAEIERLAASEGLTPSRKSAALLEAALQQNIYTSHLALFKPILEQSLAKQMRAYSNRTAILLVRSLFVSEQTRAIVANMLRRQQGVTDEVLRKILDGSSNTAKRNLTKVTPQLATFINEIEAWIRGEEGKPDEN
jgi:hypothetical protein